MPGKIYSLTENHFKMCSPFIVGCSVISLPNLAFFIILWEGGAVIEQKTCKTVLLHGYKPSLLPLFPLQIGPFMRRDWPFWGLKMAYFALKTSPFILGNCAYCSRNSCDRSPMFNLAIEWGRKKKPIEFWVAFHIIMNPSHFSAIQHFIHLFLSPNIFCASKSNSEPSLLREMYSQQIRSLH